MYQEARELWVPEQNEPVVVPPLRTRERIVYEARQQIGAPAIVHDREAYARSPEIYGMSPTEGFDCSGLVTYVLFESGYSPTARFCNQYYDSEGVPVQVYKPGDVVLISWGGIYPSHMGIITDPEEELYIHASGKYAGYVREERWEKGPIPTPLTGEVLYNANPIGYKRITTERKGRYHDTTGN